MKSLPDLNRLVLPPEQREAFLAAVRPLLPPEQFEFIQAMVEAFSDRGVHSFILFRS